MGLKPFVVFMAMMLTAFLLITLERFLNAAYFAGPWPMVYLWLVGTVFLVYALVVGTRDALRTGAKETTPTPGLEHWAAISSACYVVVGLFACQLCWERLQEPRIPMGWKVIGVLLTLALLALTVSNCRYSVNRWLRSRQLA